MTTVHACGIADDPARFRYDDGDVYVAAGQRLLPLRPTIWTNSTIIWR